MMWALRSAGNAGPYTEGFERPAAGFFSAFLAVVAAAVRAFG